jgi:hypothetical protein
MGLMIWPVPLSSLHYLVILRMSIGQHDGSGKAGGYVKKPRNHSEKAGRQDNSGSSMLSTAIEIRK